MTEKLIKKWQEELIFAQNEIKELSSAVHDSIDMSQRQTEKKLILRFIKELILVENNGVLPVVIARCNCRGDEIGTYTRTITVINPITYKKCDIDVCIAPQILELWQKGIVTIESCCGHNKHDGYVAVEVRFEKQMLDLGFKPDNRTDCPACFLIKNNAL